MIFTPYTKAILSIIFILLLGVLFLLSENFFVIAAVMFFSYLLTKSITCPKCKKSLFKTKEGKISFMIKKTCDNCQKDLNSKKP